MAKIKTIYPPIVPSLLPAFDGRIDDLRFYFKPSIANTISQVESLQVSIVRMDTNRTILNRDLYPYDTIFITKESIVYDDSKGYYYFTIDKNIFQQLDTAYKIQIRIASTDASSRPVDVKSPEMGMWLKNNIDFFSEWSIVTVVMPITIPNFGIQGLDEGGSTGINSSGYNFIGYYEPRDPNKSERLTFYQMNLYTYTDFSDKTTWKLCSSSGDRTVGAYEKVAISQVFDKDLLQNSNYVVSLTIRTKNLYTKTKIYRISGEYPVLELFNTISTEVDRDEGRIGITVNAKQILMNILPGSSIEFASDDPDMSHYPHLKASHAIVKGTIASNDNFYMYSEEDKWIAQAKIKIRQVHSDINTVYDNPFVVIKYDAKTHKDMEYYTRIKFCAFKIDLNEGYYLMNSQGNITQQSSDWEYRIIARKEVVTKLDGKETVVLEQNKTFKTKEVIVPQQEYYLFLKENQGLMNFEIQKTYKS